MDWIESMKGRRSIRSYTAEPVASSDIEKLVGAASFAPSWKNTQTARYIVIESPALREKIADSCVLEHPGNKAIIQSAPVLVVLTTIAGRSGFDRDGTRSTTKGDHWESFDAGVAAAAFCYAAHELGLGTVIMGIFDEAKVIAAAGVPEGQRVSALIALGHPAEAPAAPRRKTVEELLSYR